MSDETTNNGSTPAEGSASDEAESSERVSSERDHQQGSASDEAKSSERVSSERDIRKVRKVREGVVVSNGMDKTAVIAVVERVRHPKYNKTVLQTKKLHAHDEFNDVNVGDKVRVMETRPLSKQKRWRIIDVLERAK